MDITASNKCVHCNCKIDTPGLCKECLKRHDRIFNLVVVAIWILAAISFGYYYVLFFQ